MSSDARSGKAGKKKGVNRRQFMADATKAVGGVCAGSLLLSLYAKAAETKPAHALRPPGALAEGEFLSACVRCGLCVRACPYDTLRLAAFGDKVATGTPYFVPRDVPCYMCEDIPCMNACPTGALSPSLERIEDAKMGVARLVGTDTCINLIFGHYCNVCYRACPLKDVAITTPVHVMNDYPYKIPTVHTDKCTGCGKCEKSCILDEAAIKVLPAELAKGRLGKNMRGFGV